MPLIVPEGADEDACGIRVGNEVRRWVVGQPLIFDDAYEHETWNHTNQERVVLLFDFWHPDLIPEEITAIQDMFGFARKQGWMS